MTGTKNGPITVASRIKVISKSALTLTENVFLLLEDIWQETWFDESGDMLPHRTERWHQIDGCYLYGNVAGTSVSVLLDIEPYGRSDSRELKAFPPT